MKNNCLLCSSGNIQQLDQVKTIEIAKLYKETHGEKTNQEFEHIESLSYFECTDCGLHFFSPPITGSEEFYNLQNKSSNYYLDEKNLDNLSLDYELLSDLHLTGFSNAVALRMLSPGVKYRGLVDCTLKGRIKRRFAYRYLSPRISKIFRDSRLRPRGHSVTAVFRKK